MSAKLSKVTFGITSPTLVQYEMIRPEMEFIVSNEEELAEAKEKAFAYFDELVREYGKPESTFVKKS